MPLVRFPIFTNLVFRPWHSNRDQSSAFSIPCGFLPFIRRRAALFDLIYREPYHMETCNFGIAFVAGILRFFCWTFCEDLPVPAWDPPFWRRYDFFLWFPCLALFNG